MSDRAPRSIEIVEPDANIERAWIAEALRREADVKAGRSKLVPAKEAIERVRVRLARAIGQGGLR